MSKKKASFRFYFAMMLVIIGITAVMSALLALLWKQYTAAAVMGGAALLELISFFVVRQVFIKRFRKNTLQAAVDLEKEYCQLMTQWVQPLLILASDASVIWENEAFVRMNGKSVLGMHIDELGFDIREEAVKIDWEPITKEIEYLEHSYLVTLRKLRVDEPVSLRLEGKDFQKIYSINFRDITHEKALEKENSDLQPISALIYVDNYDQVFESMDESAKPLLEAQIYRCINALSEQVKGVLIRLEKNRFYLSFHHEYLETVEESKFRLLEEVKQISLGNKYPPTLSIGVGAAHDVFKAREFAREAVDLALGRGGDQAVVKTAERQTFYGGNSAAPETQSRVRPRQVAYALKEEMEQVDRVLVMGHAGPDMDSLGAALGVCRMAALMHKPAGIVMSDDHPAVEEFYRRLRTTRELPYSVVSEEQAREFCRSEEVLLIVVDCSRPAMMQAPGLLELATHAAVIDHHRRSEDSIRPEICYVETYVSSASEMVSELLRYTAEKPELLPLEADGLFAGIVLDTKYFTVKCGVRTFEAAAFLRRQGADSERVRELFKDDMEEYIARGSIVSRARKLNAEVLLSSWVASIPNAQAVAAQAADEMLDISGVRASYVLTQLGETVYISARSLGNNNVQLVMEELGGGGHMNVAGAQLSELSLEEAEQKLLAAMEAVEKRRV